LRLNRTFRAAVYGAFAILFGTGVAWLIVDRSRGDFGAPQGRGLAAALLMAHGGVAMLSLLLLGALIPLHIPLAWARGGNRVTGIVMLTLNAGLIVSAFALYYVGAELLRGWASDLHIALGLGLPLLLLFHVVRGKRGR
jgi:hypothetical protein